MAFGKHGGVNWGGQPREREVGLGMARSGMFHSLHGADSVHVHGKPPTIFSYITAYAWFMLSQRHMLSCEVIHTSKMFQVI